LRILVVAHDFPPLNSSASRRPYSWARAWSDRGHEVHVLTTAKYAVDGRMDLVLDLAGIHVHGAPYLPWGRPASSGGAATAPPRRSALFETIRLATRRLRLGLGLFTQTTMLAYPKLVRTGRALLASRRFDLIVSTSGPEVCTLVAHRLAGRANVPWLADYRDLWFAEFAVQRYWFTTLVTGALNARWLRRAAAASTVSEGLLGYLRTVARCPVWVCYNGFLGAIGRAGNDRAFDDGRLHIVYTGNFYPEKRDPEGFFAALAGVLAADPEFRARLQVDLYGPDEQWVRDRFAAHGLEDVVVVHGPVPYAESLAAQRSANALLFVDWMDPRAEGVLTGKLFEYLAAERPVLCVGNRRDTEAARLILDCRAGIVAATPDEVVAALTGLARGELRITPDRARIAGYSREAQAVALLDRAEREILGRAAAGSQSRNAIAPTSSADGPR
jgi:glycosyltransferase involved in cell wall biosynthesis